MFELIWNVSRFKSLLVIQTCRNISVGIRGWDKELEMVIGNLLNYWDYLVKQVMRRDDMIE